MKLKVTRGFLIGNVWQEPGSVIDAVNPMAERYLKSGAAVPHIPAPAPPIEQAARNPREAERATAPRGR